MRSPVAAAIGLALAFVIGLSAPHTARADQLDRIKQRGKIIIGIKNDYKPFGFLDPDGAVRGFEIDLAKSVAKSIMGSESAIELVPVVASNRIELLNQGRIDVIIATLGRNPERGKVIDFSEDYYQTGDSAVIAPKNTSIKTWADVRGRTLCSIQGNALNRTFEAQDGATTLLFPGTTEMFKAFEDGRCDAVAFDESLLRQQMNEPAWKERYVLALTSRTLYPIAAGVRKGEPALLAAVNKAIETAEGEGLLVRAEDTFGMGHADFVTQQAAKYKPN